MTKSKGGQQVRKFSIIIGLVSTEDRERIFECLNALRDQEGDNDYEVIIADRRNDNVSRIITSNYPEVILLPANASTSLPVLRSTALHHASGDYIIVTEDHCVPSKNWLKSFDQAIDSAPENTAAVGGCVENGVCNSNLDWATFLCEYSFFLQPIQQGITDAVPGMNIAYRREILLNTAPHLLTSGFWETTLHPLLIKQGYKLLSSNAIKLFHCKKFSLSLFLRQRFIYSRYYAGLRFRKDQRMQRTVACFATLILPPLLLYRMIRQIRSKKRLTRELWGASPYLCLFVLVWTAGEIWGYAFGSHTALEAIE